MIETQADAFKLSNELANRHKIRYGVWEHCGDYGHPEGDIKARHVFAVHEISQEPTRGWTVIGFSDPDPEPATPATPEEIYLKALREIASIACAKQFNSRYKLDRVYTTAWAAINKGQGT